MPTPHRLGGGRLGTLHKANTQVQSSMLSPPPISSLLELLPHSPASPPPCPTNPRPPLHCPHPHVLPTLDPLIYYHCSPDTPCIPLVSLIPSLSLTHQNPTSANTQVSMQAAPRVTGGTQATVPILASGAHSYPAQSETPRSHHATGWAPLCQLNDRKSQCCPTSLSFLGCDL